MSCAVLLDVDVWRTFPLSSIKYNTWIIVEKKKFLTERIILYVICTCSTYENNIMWFGVDGAGDALSAKLMLFSSFWFHTKEIKQVHIQTRKKILG